MLLVTFLYGVAEASTVPWSFEPLSPTTLTVPENSTAIVKYRVKNNTRMQYRLVMQPQQAVTQLTTGAGACDKVFNLPPRGDCILFLEIDGRFLNAPILNGPIVCPQGGGGNQCYRPDIKHQLNVLRSQSRSSITPSRGVSSGGTTVTITGLGFSGITSVKFDGKSAAGVDVKNNKTLVAVTPAHSVGTVDVTVNTSLGEISLFDAYTYVPPALGDKTSGGVIACLGGGLNDLIALDEDNSLSIVWGGIGTPTNAQSDANGAQNTSTIVNTLGQQSGTPYAAQLCDTYEIDSQGHTPCTIPNVCYQDWFLPAKDQLNCLFTNSTTTGKFEGNIYWSSTEFATVPNNAAWGGNFIFGLNIGGLLKDDSYAVRCVRQFTALP